MKGKGEPMSKQTIAEKVSEQIDAMLTQRAQEIAVIETALASANAQKQEAEASAKAAIEKTDFAAYESAKDAQRKASAAIEMYEARLKQLTEREFISEEESDRVIDSLLAYEADLAERYADDIKTPLAALEAIHSQYRQEVQNVERIIGRWTREIHANYRTPGTIYAETGTNRAPYPAPVHRVPYVGSPESEKTDKYLNEIRTASGCQ